MTKGTSYEDMLKEQNRMHELLLNNIKEHLPEFEKLLGQMKEHWGEEDLFYRFYHHSFKVYHIQSFTVDALGLLCKIKPHKATMNKMFLTIIADGTGSIWEQEHNKEWMKHTRPMLEAYAHARYFVEMVVKYGHEINEVLTLLPSGWAALLSLYGLR